MTKKELQVLRNSQATQEKLKKASNHIFEYLENEGFALAEVDFLLAELGQTLQEKQKFDPLRKLSDLKDTDYLECYSEFFKELTEQFEATASSYAVS